MLKELLRKLAGKIGRNETKHLKTKDQSEVLVKDDTVQGLNNDVDEQKDVSVKSASDLPENPQTLLTEQAEVSVKAEHDARIAAVIKRRADRKSAHPELFHNPLKVTAKRVTGKMRRYKNRRQRVAHRVGHQRPAYG